MLRSPLAPLASVDSPPLRKGAFLVTLTMLSVGGLVGSDIYLSSFPLMAQAFHVSASAVQSTLSVYLFFIACGQLVYGPLSQSIGRKNVLLFGVALYFVASCMCALSPNYTFFLMGRMGQALGAAAGLVVGRSLVSDMFTQDEAGKVFSTIFPFVGMSPALSPALGGILASFWGWRACFVFLMGFTGVLLFLVWRFVPETLPPERRHSFHPKSIVLAYGRTLTHKGFWIYLLAPCAAYMVYFSYIAQSPFILNARGVSVHVIGFLYVTLSLTYVLGNLWGRSRLGQGLALDRVLSMSYAVFFISGVLFFLNGMFVDSLLLMIVLVSCLTFANGQLIPLGVAGAVTALPSLSGYASALLGFFQFGVTSLVVMFISEITHNTIMRLGGFVLLVTGAAFLLWWSRGPRTS